jgi:hypothetical protein
MKILRLFKMVTLGLSMTGLILLTGEAFDVDIHEDITAKALSFLKPEVLADINDEHFYVDTALALLPPLNSKYHFDNCMFKESTENINSLYDEVLAALNPDKPDVSKAANKFGQLLHTVQDFYAHSNWVELVEAGHLKGIVAPGTGKWPVLEGWKIYKDEEGHEFIVCQGEERTIPTGWRVEADPGNSKIVWVTTACGQRYPGLISGTWGPSDDCFDRIALSHESLNKDNEKRPGFETAYNLALQQTKAEWERLKGLMKASYGEKGYRVLEERFL